MVVKKKHITAITLAVLLSVAGYLNLNDNNAKDEPTIADKTESEHVETGEAVMVSGSADYFTKAKNERDISRSKTTDLLNETVCNEKISDENRKKAEEEIIKIAENIDKESKCEALLKAKGFEDNMVFISDNSISVTIGKKLSETDTIKVKDIIFEQTGNNNIKIVEVK